MDLLIFLITRSVEIRSKTDCWISPNDVYAALSQLLVLAVNNQDATAAHVLLYEGTIQAPFNLDGEVAESYTGEYIIPVLEGFQGLSTVLDQSREDIIAKGICANLLWYKDNQDTSLKTRIETLIMKLNERGMGRLAGQIQACE
jgi:hypothetical protein